MPGSFLRSSAICLAALALPAFAQIHTYKDESGRVIMSDKPPPGKDAGRKKNVSPKYELDEPAPAKSAPSAPAAAKAGVDPELEKRKKDADAKAAAERAAKEKAANDEMKLACDDMKRNLTALESGRRISQLDATGERYFLDDDQRAKQIADLRRRMANCK